MDKIKEELFRMQDLKYKEFHSKLIPTINPDTVIGVRVPDLRKFANTVTDYDEFFKDLPHQYYEENNLHGFIISQIKDYDKCVEELNKFLPYVDNWATCDGIRPKCFNKNTDKLLLEIKKWISTDYIYTVRFAIEMLMTHFLDEKFDESFLKLVAGIKSDEYYINMMIAWYFATALAKQYEVTVGYIEKKILPIWVHNKTIQKAIESFRITDEKKKYLRTLKRK